MRRGYGVILLLLALLMLMAKGWAGVPENVPPIDDPLMQKFLKSLYDHLNTLECLTATPNGSVLGMHGELKCANFGGAHYICMNTGTGPSKTKTWTCLNVAGGTGSILTVGDCDGPNCFNNDEGTLLKFLKENNASISVGDSTTSSTNGAKFSLTGAKGTGTGTSGGKIVIETPDMTGTNQSSGDICLTPGVGSGTGAQGSVQIGHSSNVTGISTEQIQVWSVSTGSIGLADGTTLNTERYNVFEAPTINGVAGGSTETIDSAATVYIEDAPSGSNITFTNGPYALWIDAGPIRVDGTMTASNTVTISKADPTIFFDVETPVDTDYWMGVQDDAQNDDDDTFQIGTGSTAGSNTQVTITNAGAMTVGTINTGLGAVELAAGVWTPTTNNIQNLASSSASEGQYMRVGNTVTGSILLTVDPTLATTTTELELDLPVASNFGATSDAAGACGGDDLVSEVAGIRADSTSDELEVLWVTTSLASHELTCSFSYQIL